MNDKDNANKTTSQVISNTIENILRAEEDAWLHYQHTRDVWIEQIIHRTDQHSTLIDKLVSNGFQEYYTTVLKRL